jgi:hypothetical protein
MIMGIDIKVPISVSFLPIELVGEGSIKKMRYGDIQEGGRVVILGLHSELNVGGKTIKVIEKKDQVDVATRLDEKHVI